MAKVKPLQQKTIEQLSRRDAKRHIDVLRQEIRKHDYLYYVKNEPQISDEQYDRLFASLKRLEEAFPQLVAPDSPTQRVGATPREEFPVRQQAAPMLSLDATRDEAEVRRFDKRVQEAAGNKIRCLNQTT